MERRLGVQLRSFDPGDVDAWWERVAPQLQDIVAQGHRASAQLAARYVAQFAALERAGTVEGLIVDPVLEQIETSLRVTGPTAYQKNLTLSGSEQLAQRVMIQSLSGAARRLVLGGARDTTLRTVEESSGIRGYERVTSGSACAFCAMLASRGAVYKSSQSGGEVVGRGVREGEGRGSGSMGRGRGIKTRGSRSMGEQFHDHCVVGTTSVVGPATEVAYRRWYQGELVIVTMPSGHELAITPQHPVLTDRGWVDAGALCQSDRLACGIDAEAMMLGVPDEYQMPSLIEDVWRACGVDGLASVPVAPEDFHGDGVGTQGNVDVVRPDRFLSAIADSELLEVLAQGGGPGAGLASVLVALASESDPAFHLEGFGDTAYRSMCRCGDSRSFLSGGSLVTTEPGLTRAPARDAGLFQPALDGRSGRSSSLRDGQFRLASEVGGWDVARHGDSPTSSAAPLRPRYDPVVPESFADRLLVYADLGRCLLERLAGAVELRSPLELRRVSWSGHVFNLQTAEGWYSADSVIVSNCNCTVRPVFRDADSSPSNQQYSELWQQAKRDARGEGVTEAVMFRRLIEGRT